MEIDSTTETSSVVDSTGTTTVTETAVGGELSKDAFLNLLVAQLQYQDPLDPMDSQAMVAQLAQFSALEEMENLNDQVEQLRQTSGLLNALNVNGQTVELTTDDGDVITGTVDGIRWVNNTASILIDGEPYELDSITNISEATETTTQ